MRLWSVYSQQVAQPILVDERLALCGIVFPRMAVPIDSDGIAVVPDHLERLDETEHVFLGGDAGKDNQPFLRRGLAFALPWTELVGVQVIDDGRCLGVQEGGGALHELGLGMGIAHDAVGPTIQLEPEPVHIGHLRGRVPLRDNEPEAPEHPYGT